MLRSLNAGRFVRRLLTASLISAAALPALAEDIDIFTGKPLPGNEPNLLIILDNSTNWSSTFGTAADFAAAGCPTGSLTKFAAEMCVLTQVLTQFTTNVRIGLMLFSESGENGGYVRYAIRDVGPDNAVSKDNQTAFINMLLNFKQAGSDPDNSGSNQPYGKVMFEAFKYFGGGTGTTKDRTHFGPTAFAGWTLDTTGDKGAFRRDWRGNETFCPPGPVTKCQPVADAAGGARSAHVYGADDNFPAFANQGSRDYISPVKSACPKNFIIFISNGNPSVGGDSGGTASATQLLTNVGGTTTQITSGGVAVHASTFDEWARFLNNNDVNPDFDDEQKVITYTIAVYQPTGYRKSGGVVVKTKAECDAVCEPIASNTDQQMINLMRSGAAAGGGIYFDGSNISALKQAIARMLNEVQAKNSVFVSASLPVSVNTQGTFLNQVYMGMFRPEATGNPRWLGNLKQYKIVQDPVSLNLNLADQNDVVAINPGTGFVSPAAKSFWTVANDFWKNDPSGTPKVASDSPDGEIVEKGGAGERIRMTWGINQDPRRVYTCPDDATGCPGGAALGYQFDTTNISGTSFETKFGAANAAELTAIVRWVRGQDNRNGTPCDPLVAGCTWTSAEKGPGWDRTVRPSVHGDVLHSRPVVLNYKGTGPFIFYGANDGTLRGTKGGRLDTDGLESWAFVAPEFYGKLKRQRENAPVLKLPGTDMSITPTPLPKDYFFDGAIGSYQELDSAGATVKAYIYVTARRGGRVMYAFDVTNPTNPKFMWKKTNTSTTPPDIGKLGQTWSEPKAFKVRALPTDPVIMFGAGYDPAEDKTPADTPTMGEGVFVLNGRTGEHVAFFPVPGSPVPSDVAVIDHDFDTLADRAYVGDLKGNIWRMDIDDADPGNWKMYQFAKLGDTRKFFFRPDVVISKTYDLVLVGSGDREKPLVDDSTDRFYMLKDDKTGKSGAGLTTIEEGMLVAGNTDSSAAKGWYLDLRKGEKVINAPLSIGGVTFFSTNRPTPDPESCQPNLGEARAYAVDFLTGGAGTDRNSDGTKGTEDLSTVLKSGGLPPSPVGGVVQLDDGKLVDFIIGSGAGGSPIAPERPVREIPRVRKKLYWNTNSDK